MQQIKHVLMKCQVLVCEYFAKCFDSATDFRHSVNAKDCKNNDASAPILDAEGGSFVADHPQSVVVPPSECGAILRSRILVALPFRLFPLQDRAQQPAILFARCGRTNVDAILRPDRHSNGPDAPSVPFEIYQHPSSFPLPDVLEFEFRQFGAPQSAPDQQLQNYGRRSGKAMVDGLGAGMVGFKRRLACPPAPVQGGVGAEPGRAGAVFRSLGEARASLP